MTTTTSASTPRSARPAGPSLAAFAAFAALVLSLVLAVPPSATAAESGIAVEQTTTNGRIDPLGIPGDTPAFGWSSVATARGVVQSAYEIRVGSQPTGDDVWATGKVTSSEQVEVLYGGPELRSATRYHWQVRVWDGDDEVSAWSEPAWFETGLLNEQDWGDAAWIEHETDAVVERWTDYTAEVDFTLDDLAIGVFIRGENLGDAYMWQLSVADGTGEPKFRPHRRSGGGYTLLDEVDISSVITEEELLDGPHRLTIEANGDTITTSLNDTEVDVRTDDTHARGFLGFRSSAASEGDEDFTVHEVSVRDADDEILLRTDFAEGNSFSAGELGDDGLRFTGRVEALWSPPGDHLPVFRTEFSTDAGRQIESARVYATARGVYELSLNGEKVGDLQMAPGWTDYRTVIHHQTYDVTELVRAGENAFGAEVAPGWWSGRIAHYPAGTFIYGDSVNAIALLRIDYSDGSSQVVGTDDTWRSTTGPYVEADLIDGETYDANAELPGWDLPGYDDALWPVASTAPSATDLVEPQPDEPVRVTRELAAQEYTEPEPGHHVYDLGQNMVGVPRVTLTGRAGDTVRLRHAEELNPDGTMYTENLRSAKATDYYTFAEDGTVTYEPKFTFHGFRYVEIHGVDQPPGLGDVTGQVWSSDLRDIGTFETSNPQVNQLQSNITWGQRGNFLSIPTDTPARDERLGWTGDINVFAPTAAFNQDSRAFLRKWLDDLRVTQRPNGDLPGIAPEPLPNTCCGGATGWSDAMITVPYALFEAYADRQVIRENYQAMQNYFAFVRAGNGGSLIKNRGGYLDWLHLDDPTPAEVLSTAYYAENARMLSEMAAAIGDDAYAAELAGLSTDVREAFADAFVASDGRITGDSQAGYALALGMDLVPDELRDAVADRYVEKIEASGDHLRTGFLGTPWLLPALSGAGQDDKAFELMMRDEMPSWLYPVSMGATTMWERWDSIRPDGSFGDVGMNSFNHYAFGAVGDWMYRTIAGLQPVEPGYRASRIAPVVGGGLTSAIGSLETVYGSLSSAWEVTEHGLNLEVTVPVNTTSQVVIPAPNALAVFEGGVPLDRADGVTEVRFEDGNVIATVGSGTYTFVAHDDVGPLGRILEVIDALTERIDAHEDSGDLDSEPAERLRAGLAAVSGLVREAIEAYVAGDDDAVGSSLAEAAVVAGDTRALIDTSLVDPPVAADLDARFAELEGLLGGAVAWIHGLSFAVVPATETVRPGQRLSGAVQVASTGDHRIEGLSASVEVDGWSIDDSEAAMEALEPGESGTMPFSGSVPVGQGPGEVEATVRLGFTVGGVEYTVVESAPWVVVGSDLTITEVLAAQVPAGGDRAEIVVTVENSGAAEAQGQVFLEMPAGWARAVPSAPVTVPAEGSIEVELTTFLPRSIVAGDYAIGAEFREHGFVYAAGSGTIDVDLPEPAAGEFSDHVDFGEAASEEAHAVQSSPSSGTSTEAGYTRRYAHQGFPGSWFSAEVEVPAGEAFAVRLRETFNGATTKRYEVYVDDVLVDLRTVPRSESGAGVKMHQLVVDDPEVLDHDGSVRIRFEYPEGAVGFHDPSIADLWVMPIEEDTTPPVVGAVPDSSAAPGANGWSRGPVNVSVVANDDRDPDPQVQYGTGSGWADYTGPVQISGDGVHDFHYRASDAAGNSSGTQTLAVRIDGTPPVTDVSVAGSGGGQQAVLFEARDQVSGVDSTWVRIDGDAWIEAVSGDSIAVPPGARIEFYSVDVAGNAEAVRAVTVDELPDVELPVVEPVDESELTEENRGSVRVPDEAMAGERIEVSVGADQAGEAISVWFYSTPVDVGWQVVDTDGTVSVTVPADAELGAHRIVVYDDEADLFGWDDIAIVEPDDGGGDGDGGGSGDGDADGGSGDGSAGPGGDGSAGSGGFIPGVGNTASQALLYTALLLLMLGGAVLWLRRGLHIR